MVWWWISAANPIIRSPGCGFSASKIGLMIFALRLPHFLALGCVGIVFWVADGFLSDDLGVFCGDFGKVETVQCSDGGFRTVCTFEID